MRHLLVGTAALVLFAGGSAEAQVERLEVASRPRLVECLGKACFRIAVNALDAHGQPVPLGVGADSDAVKRFHVFEGDRPLTVFHAGRVQAETADARARGRYSMLLLDVSGSMRRPIPGTADTRFTAAKKALDPWVTEFEDGVDHVAVVPFESHGVVARIQKAVFAASRAEMRRNIDSLPVPGVGNTALYSAVTAALSVLKPLGDDGSELLLIVFTDGANDVRAGDDPDLLGLDGLQRARQVADEMGVPIFTIGFGGKGQPEFDTDALRALAWPGESNFRVAGTPEALQEVFQMARKKLTNRFELTLGPVRNSKGELFGQTVSFRVAFDRPGASPIESRTDKPWVAGVGGEPGWEDHLTTHELDDFVSRQPAGDRLLSGSLVRVLVLLVYAALLAVLWFGLPRLIWPERYLARSVVPPPAPPPRPRSGGPAPNRDTDITRSPTRLASLPRSAPSGEAPAPRKSDEPTVFIPSDRKPRKGR